MIHTYESNEQKQGQNMLFTNKLFDELYVFLMQKVQHFR